MMDTIRAGLSFQIQDTFFDFQKGAVKTSSLLPGRTPVKVAEYE